MIHLKYFQVHTVFTKIPVNKTFPLSLDCFRADVFSAPKRLFLSHSCINVASSIFTIGVDSNKKRKIYKSMLSMHSKKAENG